MGRNAPAARWCRGGSRLEDDPPALALPAMKRWRFLVSCREYDLAPRGRCCAVDAHGYGQFVPPPRRPAFVMSEHAERKGAVTFHAEDMFVRLRPRTFGSGCRRVCGRARNSWSHPWRPTGDGIKRLFRFAIGQPRVKTHDSHLQRHPGPPGNGAGQGAVKMRRRRTARLPALMSCSATADPVQGEQQ